GGNATKAGVPPEPCCGLLAHPRSNLPRDRFWSPGGFRLKPAADRLDDERLGALDLLVRLGDDVEDPGGQELLDRAVEAHGRELARDVRLERPVAPCVVDNLPD